MKTYLKNGKEEITNEVVVNDIELASELADLATRREMFDNESIDEDSDEWNKMYVTDDEETRYTEEAQDIFNGWYDYYTSQIEKYSVASDVKIYSLSQAVADIAFIAGRADYYNLDTRGDIDSFIIWAKEFEAVHQNNEWIDGDYIETITDFANSKISQCETDKKTDVVPIVPKETRVYGVNHDELPSDYDANRILANDDFIVVAEEQGNVWSLKGFEEQFNNDGDEVNQNNLSIRII